MRKRWPLVILLMVILLPVARLSSQNKSTRADDSRVKALEEKVHDQDLRIEGLEDKVKEMRETLDDASSRFYFVESDIIWLKADVSNLDGEIMLLQQPKRTLGR